MAKLTALVLMICLFCAFSEPKAQEHVDRNVKPFHSIVVSSGVDLYLKQGDAFSVEVECEKDYVKRLETKTEDSVLIIKAVMPLRWGFDKSPKVYVVFVNLRSLVATSGADVYGSGVFLFDKLAIAAHGGADIYLTMDCHTLKISASGGSDIKVSGKSHSLKATVASGSDLNAADLKSDHCDVTATGGSDAIVNVSMSLSADANGGSDIGYIGDPPVKELVETGGSDIYRK